MYAIIQTGGKQYRVQKGDILRVEKLNDEVGANIDFDHVLMLGDNGEIKVGADAAKAKVSAIVRAQGRGPKIVVFKKRRRKNYKLTKGHRQDFTAVQITEVAATGGTGKKAAAPKAKPVVKAEAKVEAKAETKAEAKPAEKKAAAPKKEVAEKAPAKKAAPKAKAEAKPAEKKAAEKAPAKKAAPKAKAEAKPAAKKAATKATKADKE